MKAILKAAAGLSMAASMACAAPSIAGASGPAGPSNPEGPSSPVGPGDHLVFVQTDNAAGNQVLVYDRAPNGTLAFAGDSSTGGRGGTLEGSQVDHLASQGSLVYDPAQQLLYGVNAGSNTFYVFSVSGSRLTLLQVVTSGGSFPVSIAVHDDLVYVLNAQAGGSVSGFRWGPRGLQAIPGSTRSLGLTTMTGTTTQFTHTPGQIAFSPDGSKLLVTTKAGGQSIDVFGVGPGGIISPAPYVYADAGQVPFAIAFGPASSLLVANAGTDSVSSFALELAGPLKLVSTASTTQSATCWIAQAGGYFYASNAGSASLSTLKEGPWGQVSVIGRTATDAGTVDAAASADGQYLYVQTGASGVVDEFKVEPSGALSEVGRVTVPGAIGGEGIAAS